MSCDNLTIEADEDPERINSFDFLRTVGMLMVFCGHVWAILPFDLPDFGGRAVDLFFLLSGFLYTYNYYNKELKTTQRACVKFAYSHIKKYYCLHLITGALMLFQLYITGSINIKLDGGYGKGIITNYFLNLLLLQSWIPSTEYYFGFNGVAWFLSSLVFCYYLFPIMLSFIKRKKTTAELGIFWGGGVILLLAILQTWYSVGHLAESYYYCYIFPPYRAVWFFIGCIAGAIFLRNRDYLKSSIFGNDGTCIVAVLLYGLSVFFCNSSWNSAIYLIPTVFLIFIIACCSKNMEKLFSCRIIKWLSNFSFEFYLIHHVVVIYYAFIMGYIRSNFGGMWLTDVVIIFVFSIALSVLFSKTDKLVYGLLKGHRATLKLPFKKASKN